MSGWAIAGGANGYFPSASFYFHQNRKNGWNEHRGVSFAALWS
jgi:hypothetical protein